MPATTSPEIDALFHLPLNEFTSARNALVTKLKKNGHSDAAAQVKALPRPPVAAWAVNQLYWRHRHAFDALAAAGERLRTAQASQLRRAGSAGSKGGDLRKLLEAQRVALADLTGRATALLQEAEHTPSPDLMRRVATTLDALTTYGARPDGPQPGRLTEEVDAPGFEALTSLVPRTGARARGGAPTRVIPFHQRAEGTRGAKKLGRVEEKQRRDAERTARRTAAAAAVREAARALSAARRNAARAEAALKAAAARARQAQHAKDVLATGLEKATADADKARQEARRIAAEAEAAAQEVADGERELGEAGCTPTPLLRRLS